MPFKRIIPLSHGLQTALPYPDDAPAEGCQLGLCAAVALYVAAYLLLPEPDVTLRQPIVAAILMAMPEAAVDEYNSPVLRQDYVRLAGKIPDLKTETQTPGEEILPAIQRLRCSGVIVSAIS